MRTDLDRQIVLIDPPHGRVGLDDERENVAERSKTRVFRGDPLDRITLRVSS